MVVVDLRQNNTKLFKDIGGGVCFEYDGNLYIKLLESIVSSATAMMVNAVNLIDGSPAHFDNSDVCELVNSEIVLHNIRVD